MSSSSRRLAIMGAIHTHNFVNNSTSSNNNYSENPPGTSPGSYHAEVNTLLAGSMMMTLSFLVVGLCFFLHKKFKKEPGPVSLHALPWTDDNLEVFTLSGQEEITGIYMPPPTPSPPPAYESVVKVNIPDKEMESEKLTAEEPTRRQEGDKMEDIDDDELPTYEAAIKLGAYSYI